MKRAVSILLSLALCSAFASARARKPKPLTDKRWAHDFTIELQDDEHQIGAWSQRNHPGISAADASLCVALVNVDIMNASMALKRFKNHVYTRGQADAYRSQVSRDLERLQ